MEERVLPNSTEGIYYIYFQITELLRQTYIRSTCL